MNIFEKAMAVWLKKCCFCDKKFGWKDSITVNINNKKIAHHACYIRFKNKFKRRDDDFDALDCEFYG
jgi:hypothetical protein